MSISLVADPSGTSGKIQVAGVDVATAKNTGVLDVPKGIGGTPAFRAKLNSTQVIVDVQWNIISTWVDVLDTSGAMGATQFVPQAAGWYQINASIELGGTGITIAGAAIHVNGLPDAVTYIYTPSNNQTVVSVSGLVYLNGSTDYVDIRAYVDVASSPVVGPLSKCSGVLVRAA